MCLVDQAARLVEKAAVERMVRVADPFDRVGEAGKLLLGHEGEGHANQGLVSGDGDGRRGPNLAE